jgi:hypothetical protein
MPDGKISGEPERRPPFTADSLRLILDGVLKRGTKPGHADLATLAKYLNLVHGTFRFAVKVANKSKPAADKVSEAFAVLMHFFEERRSACQVENSVRPSVEIVESEKQLYNDFYGFVRTFEAHEFNLDMDAGLLMRHIDHWHDLAEMIAGAFKVAMSRNNDQQTLGLSNDGPVPRFVAATIPLITGEKPSAQAVGKWLKDQARARKRRSEMGTDVE